MIASEPPDYLAEDACRGQEAYDRHVRPLLRAEDDGKFVAINIETGDREIDADDYRATGRLLARCPGARLWLLRVGEATAYRMGRWIGGGRNECSGEEDAPIAPRNRAMAHLSAPKTT